jgi:hypothetical protein
MAYTYTLTAGSSILRSDGCFVPADPANNDYDAYLTWVAAGNTAAPVPTPPVPPSFTPGAFLALFTPQEQLAVQTACNSNMTLLLGLTTGIASGNIVLTSPAVIAWVNALATAGALTSARAAAILAS